MSTQSTRKSWWHVRHASSVGAHLDGLVSYKNVRVSLDSRNSTWRTWGGARAEAQSLLDNMALALKVPKNEPIEPTLPDVSS